MGSSALTSRISLGLLKKYVLLGLTGTGETSTSPMRCDCKTEIIQPQLPASESYQVFVHEPETPPNLIWGEGHSLHPMGGRVDAATRYHRAKEQPQWSKGMTLGREINLSNAPHPVNCVQAIFFTGICLSDQSPLHLLIGLN